MHCIEAQNKVASRMKLKMHSKTSPNSCRRGGVRKRKEERANRGEEKSALVFKRIMPQSVTMTLT